MNIPQLTALCLRYQGVLLDASEEVVHVAVVDAPSHELLDALHFATTKRIEITCWTRQQMEGHASRTQQTLPVAVQEKHQPKAELLTRTLQSALEQRASDIHIEPADNAYRIRLRIDGVLHPLPDVSPDAGVALTARLKVLGNLDIAEHRLPQDGQFTVELCSCLATTTGTGAGNWPYRQWQNGHLVLSTLHTNSTTETLVRLQQMGVARWMLSSALTLVIAQRLVRKLCPHCRRQQGEPIHIPDTVWPSPLPHWQAPGCVHCYHGFYGRTALFEVLPITPAIRQLISANTEVESLETHARQAGMRTLFENGCLAVEQGLTTFEELIRVLGMPHGK